MIRTKSSVSLCDQVTAVRMRPDLHPAPCSPSLGLLFFSFLGRSEYEKQQQQQQRPTADFTASLSLPLLPNVVDGIHYARCANRGLMSSAM